MIFLLFGFITWRLVLEMMFLWAIAGLTYLPNKVLPYKVSQKSRTLLLLSGLALVGLLRSPAVGFHHAPPPKNFVASAYQRVAPTEYQLAEESDVAKAEYDVPWVGTRADVAKPIADSEGDVAITAPAKSESDSETQATESSGRKLQSSKLQSSGYRPLEVRWKKASSFKDNYKRTSVDAAWTNALLNPGDGLCIEGDGYAGFDYPEGPPSFFVNIKNKQADRLVHFNPRRGQNIIVVNHMLSKKWGTEKRVGFPAAWRKDGASFTLCMIMLEKEWRFELNKAVMKELPSYPRRDPSPKDQPLEVWIEVVHVKNPRLLLKESSIRV